MRSTRLMMALALSIVAGGLFATGPIHVTHLLPALILLASTVGLAWPLLRPTVRIVSEPVRVSADARADLPRLLLDQMPIAVWQLDDGKAPQPLSVPARRLLAPGGVRDPDALRSLLGQAADSGPIVLETERGSERWQLRRQALTVDGQPLAIVALVPLEQALEQESLQAWQQLVQVLTHEIMNSLTPIRSLSQTAASLVDDEAARDDLRIALEAIGRRADGLSSFVENYRRASHWPAPELAPVDLQALFRRLEHAVAPAWAARGGEARFELEASGLRLMADEAQLEQALLALISNAACATDGIARPRLSVHGRQRRGGRLQISVRDNGPGLEPGTERKIFLPFFTTREDGQGIGLTVARQLVNGMGGRIRHVRPIEGSAEFVLMF